jgi:hypothetical protein
LVEYIAAAQKDLADMARLVETHPELKERLPAEIRLEVE